jgi:YD repeat-containing protein
MKNPITPILASLVLASIISSTPVKAQPRQTLTEEMLWDMQMVGTPQVAPDGKSVLYGVRYNSLAQNKGQTDLFVLDLATGNSRRLTQTTGSEHSYSWHTDGQRIGYLSAEGGSTQLWEMSYTGGEARQVTRHPGGISGYGYSPAGNRIFFTASVALDSTLQQRYPGLPKSTGMLFDGLMYRHWDQFTDGSYSHVFIQDYRDGALQGQPADLMAGERFHCPMPPFGGTEQIVWSPKGDFLVYTSKKLQGTEAAQSTNSDLYVYELATGQTVRRTKGLMGYDTDPQFSPDGRYLAWLSMERDGYEADRNRIMLMAFPEGEIREATAGFDLSVESMVWSNDGNRILFNAGTRGTVQVFEYALDSIVAARSYGLRKNQPYRNLRQVSTGTANYGGLAFLPGSGGGALVVQKQDMLRPGELYRIDLATGAAKALTDHNGGLFADLKPARVESREIRTTDGKSMQTWVIYPPDFDSTRRYPTLLYCQGGPQSMIGQSFSTRWNFYLMASKGYIVVAPNRRGLPGFGQEWNEAISGDWGGQAMQDYLSAIDHMGKQPFVDANRLGAVGASFGGYSVYWLAGNHNNRFKAFIAHCGIYNLEAMFGQTEEIFFTDFDMKGRPWDKPTPRSYRDFSPHRFVGNWNTPILVIHNEKDFRVPLAQGMEAFTAAQLRGVKSQFLYFPDENHWVIKPQNSVLWQKIFFNFLEENLNSKR